MSQTVPIKTSQIHSNFIQIPSNLQFIIRIGHHHFLSNLIYSPEITLDTLVFKANSIPSECTVEYIPVESIKIHESINVTPKSPSDWEIISSNPALFESLFLVQCQLVYESQIVILRHKSLIVELVVKSGLGRVMEGSRVIIEPNERFKSTTRILRVALGETSTNDDFVKIKNYDYEKVLGQIELVGIYRAKVDGNYVVVEEDVMKEMDLVQYSLVKVSTIDTSLKPTVNKIKAGMKGDFKSWIHKRKSKWICDGMCVDKVKINIIDDLVVEMTDEILGELEVEYDRKFTPPELTKSILKFDDYGFDEIDEGVKYFEKLIPKFNLSLNLYGPSASGKTTMAKMIGEKLKSFVIVVESQLLHTLSNEDFKKKLENIWQEAVYHSAVVIIKLNEGIKSMEKDARNDFVERGIKSCLRKMLGLGIKCIIVSSEKLVGWPVGLARGVDNLDKPRLTKVLSKFVNHELAEEVSGLLEGYSLGELKGLVGNAILNARLRNGIVNRKDFVKATESIKPLALTSSNLSTPTVTWDDIGGHHDIKKILLQTLKWPSVYKRIFAQSTLRLRSGILLYGYPGCGKTMIAQALATECSLNLITINGPELLNKYIGESEKSTRNVFSRARMAKPCILFFDEFEAIAPKRGSDSSGVTDRVVNQLLTEIDGAEGLEGVYVLAATSRPDLIDQALLRPGRLDKRVLVGMPSLEDRSEILAKLGRKLEFEADMDQIARRTEGFTGADLQGLISAAQLMAINQKLDNEGGPVVPDVSVDTKNNESGDHENHQNYVILDGEQHVEGVILRSELDQKVNDIVKGKSTSKNNTTAKEIVPKIVIRYEHIREALKDARSSMMVDEKRRLDHIYTKFAGGEIDVNVGSKSAFA